MQKRGREIVIVLLILVPLMTLLWLPILSSDIKPWEAGSPIPSEPPSEDRRLQNEAGFSIISPPNWIARNNAGRIYLTPKQVIAGRSPAGLLVSLLGEEAPDLQETETVIFQAQPARLKLERRHSTFDDPALTTWRYFFERHGQWWEVSYYLADAHEQIPEMAWRYLETLKISENESGRGDSSGADSMKLTQ